MTVDTALVGVCVLVGVWVLVQLGRYVLGGGRGELVRARVVRMWQPAVTGARWVDGVPAQVAFVAPGTDREMVLAVRGGRGGKLNAAWEGREVLVRCPAGKPERFQVVDGRGGADRRVLSAAVGLFVIGITLAARFTSGSHRFGLAMTGFGVLWTVMAATLLVLSARESARRRTAMSRTPVAVTGRVVAVLGSHRSREAGEAGAVYTPVVAFTTVSGIDVLGVSHVGRANRRTWAGREVPVLYAPADPAVFHLDYPSDNFAADFGAFLLAFFLFFGVVLSAAGLVVAGI
jgi:hypothetical protein